MQNNNPNNPPNVNNQPQPAGEKLASETGMAVGALAATGYTVYTGAFGTYMAASSATLGGLTAPIAGTAIAPIIIPMAIGVAAGGLLGWLGYGVYNYFRP